MRKPEQLLSDRTGQHLRKAGIYAERVENAVGSGMPDLLTASNDVITWIEHKVIEWPAKAATRVQFIHPPTPEQINWHRVWTQDGRRSLFLIRNGTGAEARIFVVDGTLADRLPQMTRAEIENHETTYESLIRHLQGWSLGAALGKKRPAEALKGVLR